MSAEKHALEAALQYSKQLENRIKELEKGIEQQHILNGELLRQVEKVKDAVRDRDRPYQEPMCESTHQATPYANLSSEPSRCKNCGAPV